MLNHVARVAYVAGVLLVGAFLHFAHTHGWMKAETFREEAMKLALQVLVVGLVGGAVQLLLDQQEQRRTFRADMLDRLGRVHKAVYRVRRLYGAAEDGEKHALLGELVDARQDLGTIPHTVRVWGYAATFKTIQAEVTAMRAYLEALVEAALPPGGGAQGAAFTEFLDWRGAGTTYATRFKGPYLRTKKLVDPSFEAPT